MHLNSIHKQILNVMLVALFVATASSIFAQVAPSSTETNVPISLGAGFSNYDVDWAKTRMDGYTLWADVRPPFLPHILDGLNIEFEGRDLDWHQGDKPPGYRQIVGSGGAMYEWRRYPRIHPYIKGLMGFGSIYFGECIAVCSTTPYTHDTRTVYSPGGGFEYRVFRNIWARADYEYQFWPKLTGNTFLNPQGFTFGGMYDFGHRRGQ